MKIKMIIFNKEVIPPVRKHYNDAGADVYAMEDVYIKKGHTAKIPLGFGVEIPDGYMGCIYTRSSMAARGLACEMPPIDSGYRGEIHCMVTNHTHEMVKLSEGERIGQLVIQPIVYADFVEELGDERKSGAFGSTGA